jgi:hypothetical protein
LAAAAVAETEVHNVLGQLLTLLTRTAGDAAADNAPGLDALAALLASRRTHLVHARGVCIARFLTAQDEAVWSAFVARLAGAPLAPSARALLADPSKC